MSRQLRVALAAAGVVLMLISLLVLAYAVWPADSAREQYPLAPTVFAQPR